MGRRAWEDFGSAELNNVHPELIEQLLEDDDAH